MSNLPLPDKRLTPLSDEQHAEIARLVRSSMDSTAKNPQPSLTYEGRIVARREVTTLARVAGVRRLKGNAATFIRALAEFERKLVNGEPVDARRGRLAIEHLWRWLHGYVTPQPTEEERQAQIARWAEEERAREAVRRRAIMDDLRGMTLILPGGGVVEFPSPDDTVAADEWPDVIGGEA